MVDFLLLLLLRLLLLATPEEKREGKKDHWDESRINLLLNGECLSRDACVRNTEKRHVEGCCFLT